MVEQPDPKASRGDSAVAQRERQAATIRYIDRADVAETFADSITGVVFDGQTLRIEFGVTRLDEVKPNTPITGRRYPACRVVLPPAAAIDLINRMQQIATALTQAGVVRSAPASNELSNAGTVRSASASGELPKAGTVRSAPTFGEPPKTGR
jgi:hypothetical protein